MTGRVVVATPLGRAALIEANGALVAVDWTEDDETPARTAATPATSVATAAAVQLTAYFAGDLKIFDLPLAPQGTAFRLSVWRAMLDIPYGQTRSYGDVARLLGSGPRAVGSACGANPLPIIVPCHRILASNGLGGYSARGGLDVKRFLLNLEARRRA